MSKYIFTFIRKHLIKTFFEQLFLIRRITKHEYLCFFENHGICGPWCMS